MRRLVLTDLDRGTVHEFRDTEVRLGRDPRCELPVDAPASADVSSFHARLSPRPTGWCLTDERSAGGTWVNHVRLNGTDVALLRAGDVIRVGQGAAARRFRIVKVELNAAGARANTPVRLDSESPAETRAADARVVGAALAGSAAVTGAAVAFTPALSHAQSAAAGSPVTAPSAPPAPAGTSGADSLIRPRTPIGKRADLQAMRASRLFDAASTVGGGAATAATTGSAATAVWGMLGGAALVSALAVGAYIKVDAPAANAAQPAAASAALTNGASATRASFSSASKGAEFSGTAGAETERHTAAGAADAIESAATSTAGKLSESDRRLAAAAAAVGNVIGEVSVWRSGAVVRGAGVVVNARGTMIVAEVVAGGSAAPDSIRVTFPRQDQPLSATVDRKTTAGPGLSVLHITKFSGAWLDPEAQAKPTPGAWAAVVGFDTLRNGAAPAIVASRAEVRVGPDGDLSIAGASSRMATGSAVVDATGHVLGVLTAPGQATSLTRALQAAGVGF